MHSNGRRVATSTQRPPFSTSTRRRTASPLHMTTNAYANTNAYSNTNSYANTNAYSNTNSYANTNAYSNTNAYANTNAYSNTNAYAASQSRKSVSRAASAGPRRSRPATPDGRRVTFSDPSGGKSLSAPGGGGGGPPVHTLLAELVEISQALAAYLQSGGDSVPASSRPAHSQQQQQATLKAQEIERIVKRVEGHFAEKITAMERRERMLTETIEQLRGERQQIRQQANGNQSGESDMLAGNQAMKTGEADGVAVRELRRMLQDEKRQRLFVEEQTQSLTEQHARVVTTLERRLQKQEDQLHDMLAALDQDQQNASQQPSSPGFAGSVSSLMSSPTPRRMLRQQLAQHQQTQKVLEAYQHSLHNAKSAAVAVKPSGTSPEGASTGQHAHSVERNSNNKNSNNKNYNNNSDIVGNRGADNEADEDDADELLVELGISDVAAVRGGKRKQDSNLPEQKHYRNHDKKNQAVNELLTLSNAPATWSNAPPQPPALLETQKQKPQQQKQQQQQHTHGRLREKTPSTERGRASEEMDDIALFLDNITRELESIDAAESRGEKDVSLLTGHH